MDLNQVFRWKFWHFGAPEPFFRFLGAPDGVPARSGLLLPLLVTPILWERLHWLHIRERIAYKLCILVYKALHKSTLTYLTELCTLVSQYVSRGGLCYVTRGDLFHMAACAMWPVGICSYTYTFQATVSLAGMCFHAPVWWHRMPCLPSTTITEFEQKLKSRLFGLSWYPDT